MAGGHTRRRLSTEKASRCRENDRQVEVSSVNPSVADTAEDERQIRETLAQYFAILREWDQRLRQNESENVPEFREP
jgi:hypothetical protein